MLLLLALACAPPAVDAPPLVLLDPFARQARVSLRVDEFSGLPVLPLALDEGETAQARYLDEAQPVEPAAGELAWVRASTEGLTVDYLLLDDDIDPEAAVVEGSPAAIEALASALQAEATALPGGRATLSAPTLWVDLAGMGDPDGILGLEPLFFTDPATPAARAALGEGPGRPVARQTRSVLPALRRGHRAAPDRPDAPSRADRLAPAAADPALTAAATTRRLPPALVGLYVSGEDCRILSVMGAALDCADPDLPSIGDWELRDGALRIADARFTPTPAGLRGPQGDWTPSWLLPR